MKTIFTTFPPKLFAALMAVLLLTAVAGCGGTTSSGIAGGSAGGNTGGSSGSTGTGVGVTIVTPVDIPSLNVNDFDFVGVTSSASLSAKPLTKSMPIGDRLKASLRTKDQATDGKLFSFAFCNQKQCLIETLRHALDIEAFLCFLRKIAAADSTFTFTDDNAYHYFDFTISDSRIGDFPVKGRIKKNGNDMKVQICNESTNTLFEELVINQTSLQTLDGIRATVTTKDPTGVSAGIGQFAIEANCKPKAFLENAKCRFGFQSKFQDDVGQGNIKFSASGGAKISEITHDLEANFSAGDASTSSAEAFSILVKSQWGAGDAATGASNVDFGDGGTYPPFRRQDFSADDSDPIFSICPKADYYCDNPKFDEADSDSCPVVVAKSGAAGCPISASQSKITDCYSIEGTSLVDQKGYVLDCAAASVADHYATVGTATTLKQNVSIDFSETWNCKDNGAAKEINLSGVDISECVDQLVDSMDPLAQEDCFSQDSIADGGENEFCDGDEDSDGTKNCEDESPFSSATCTDDFDCDGVTDASDNCPFKPNVTQADTDGDMIGYACAAYNDYLSADLDDDGVTDYSDNCMFDENEDQADTDDDDYGDVCDPCPSDATDACLYVQDVIDCADYPCAGDFDCQQCGALYEDDVYLTGNVRCDQDTGLCELK